MMSMDELNNILQKNKGRNSILLGNGFNLALSVDTSYKALFDSLMKSKNIKDIVNDNFTESMEDSNYNLEKNIVQIQKHHRGTIRDRFYNKLLKKCQKRIHAYNELIDFLCKFDKYFTVNYDPLLYRYLLMQKKQTDLLEDTFYEDLKSIHSGEISFDGTYGSIPLQAVTKKQVYEIAVRVFKQKYKNKRMEDYYNVLKKLRNDPELVVNDGFTIHPKQGDKKNYRTWNYKDNNHQNIFYLHGALNIYLNTDEKIGQQSVRKITLKKGSPTQDFIDKILSQFEEENYSCVFLKTSSEKLEKIQSNQYLANCLKNLKEAQGLLVIIGWSASEGDQHLIDAINKSKVQNIYISYCTKNPEYEKKLRDYFKNKEIFFFDASILPFFKKKPKNIKKKERNIWSLYEQRKGSNYTKKLYSLHRP